MVLWFTKHRQCTTKFHHHSLKISNKSFACRDELKRKLKHKNTVFIDEIDVGFLNVKITKQKTDKQTIARDAMESARQTTQSHVNRSCGFDHNDFNIFFRVSKNKLFEEILRCVCVACYNMYSAMALMRWSDTITPEVYDGKESGTLNLWADRLNFMIECENHCNIHNYTYIHTCARP